MGTSIQLFRESEPDMHSASRSLVTIDNGDVRYVPAVPTSFARDFLSREFARLTRAAIANGKRVAAAHARERAYVDYQFDRLTRAAIANERVVPIRRIALSPFSGSGAPSW